MRHQCVRKGDTFQKRNANHCSHRADSHGGSANNRDNPGSMLLYSPAVPKQTDGYEQAAEDHRRQSILRLHYFIILLCKVHKNLTASSANEKDTDYRAYSQPDKSKPAEPAEK